MMETVDSKAQLVLDICAVSSAFVSCTHRSRSMRKSPFIDWYSILRVDGDASVDVIRRRYRQFALQLHPDKNDHPNAEVAFKLVYEAYSCLSDKARRKTFDSERQGYFCKECYRELQSSPHDNCKNTERRKSYRTLQALKEVQNRIKEENRVIENCLRAVRDSRQESPLFDPSDKVVFPDYPHLRAHVLRKPQEYHYFHRREVSCDSPPFDQIKSARSPSTTRSPPGFKYRRFSCSNDASE